jgi:hypothetical protein
MKNICQFKDLNEDQKVRALRRSKETLYAMIESGVHVDGLDQFEKIIDGVFTSVENMQTPWFFQEYLDEAIEKRKMMKIVIDAMILELAEDAIYVTDNQRIVHV